MSLKSWGNFPRIISQVVSMRSLIIAQELIRSSGSFICYGNGRSYGDSALGEQQLDVRPHNKFLKFDKESGILEAQSGVILGDILTVCVPHKWHLPVVPGTKLITLGGAIAADVHGKNHHIKGCFSSALLSFKLMLPSTEEVNCSRSENSDLFHATCGGQGLTGIILSARIQLESITSSQLSVTTLKANNLTDAFTLFEDNKDAPYSVAWIDCCAQGSSLGRSLISLAEFTSPQNQSYAPRKRITMPFYLPSFVLNKWVVKIFNAFYFHRIRSPKIQRKSDHDSFFFPLDSLRNWNRIYGKKGFVQYQFILPLASSFEGMREILEHIAASGRASFLAVLKLHGPVNDNLLSFPLAGYSLALDFKINDGLFEFLDMLDQKVLKHGGRIYLAKDARVSKGVFMAGYPKVAQFKQLRKNIKASDKFHSKQSIRLGL